MHFSQQELSPYNYKVTDILAAFQGTGQAGPCAKATIFIGITLSGTSSL